MATHILPPPSRRCAKVLVFQERWEYGQLVGYDCTNEPGLPVSEEELQRPRDPLITVDSDLLRCLTEVLNKGRYDNWKVHSIVEKRPVGNQVVEEVEEGYQPRTGQSSPRLSRRRSDMLYEQESSNYFDRYFYADRPRGTRYGSRELASPVMSAEYPSPPKCQFNILIEGEEDNRSRIHPQQPYYPNTQHNAPGAQPHR